MFEGAIAIYYLFIVNDIIIGGETFLAEKIVMTLLSQGQWFLTSQAAYVKSMKDGDKVIVYYAGLKRRYFGASFTLAGAPLSLPKSPSQSCQLSLRSMFSFSVPIRDQEVWSLAVYIAPMIPRLHFITQPKNWGLFVRQGVKTIDQDDYWLIIEEHDRQLGLRSK